MENQIIIPPNDEKSIDLMLNVLSISLSDDDDNDDDGNNDDRDEYSYEYAIKFNDKVYIILEKQRQAAKLFEDNIKYGIDALSHNEKPQPYYEVRLRYASHNNSNSSSGNCDSSGSGNSGKSNGTNGNSGSGSSDKNNGGIGNANSDSNNKGSDYQTGNNQNNKNREIFELLLECILAYPTHDIKKILLSDLKPFLFLIYEIGLKIEKIIEQIESYILIHCENNQDLASEILPILLIYRKKSMIITLHKNFGLKNLIKDYILIGKIITIPDILYLGQIQLEEHLVMMINVHLNDSIHNLSLKDLLNFIWVHPNSTKEVKKKAMMDYIKMNWTYEDQEKLELHLIICKINDYEEALTWLIQFNQELELLIMLIKENLELLKSYAIRQAKTQKLIQSIKDLKVDNNEYIDRMGKYIKKMIHIKSKRMILTLAEDDYLKIYIQNEEDSRYNRFRYSTWDTITLETLLNRNKNNLVKNMIYLSNESLAISYNTYPYIMVWDLNTRNHIEINSYGSLHHISNVNNILIISDKYTKTILYKIYSSSYKAMKIDSTIKGMKIGSCFGCMKIDSVSGNRKIVSSSKGMKIDSFIDDKKNASTFEDMKINSSFKNIKTGSSFEDLKIVSSCNNIKTSSSFKVILFKIFNFPIDWRNTDSSILEINPNSWLIPRLNSIQLHSIHQNFKLIRIFNGHKDTIKSLRKITNITFCSYQDYECKIWNLYSSQCLLNTIIIKQKLHSEPIHDICALSKTILAISTNKIIFWDYRKNQKPIHKVYHAGKNKNPIYSMIKMDKYLVFAGQILKIKVIKLDRFVIDEEDD